MQRRSPEGTRRENRDGASRHAIAVLIVSGRGMPALDGAIRSVLAQDTTDPIHITVVGDDAPWLPGDIAAYSSERVDLTGFCIHGGKAFKDLPTVERVARLRNVALALARGRYICFLDDDNRWEREHLSTLRATLETTGADAAYSWRQLFDAHGRPWRAHTFPWGRCTARKARLFEVMCEAGVMQPGSHVFRDSTEVSLEGTSVAAVDMGSWLFRSSMFRGLRFETDYSEWEIQNSVTEDDKLLSAMLGAGLALACTGRPTLRYALGGYSNQWQGEGGRDE